MGNLVSQDNYANNSNMTSMRGGSTYTNNFDELQKKLEKIVKNSKNNTISDTINFTKQSESDIDFDSIKELAQNGGGYDFVTAHPRRNRYSKNENSTFETILRGGGEPEAPLKPNSLSSISEEDYKLLQEVLRRHNRGIQQIQGQHGGCGCAAGNDNLISDTSPQPVNYDILKGGNAEDADTDKKKKDKKKHNEEDDESSSDDDYDTDSEAEDDSSEEEDAEDDDDDDYDESADGDELARTSKSSSSSASSQKKHKSSKKHQKRHMSSPNSEYLGTSQNGGSSEEIVIDSKYLYSDHNTVYGSDEHSEMFKAIKNRTMLR